MTDTAKTPNQSYDASSIEVLEGLEPVRKRPGMYIGGTDATAMHHLVNEVLDNSMDEAVAGHADTIWVTLHEGNRVTVTDNGRGIPVDPHPKFKNKSALEVIMTTLHSGGKFSNKAYATSGGLHGVGVSVVNALSVEVAVEVIRNRQIYQQMFSRGTPKTPLEKVSIGEAPRANGTSISFVPDPDIFGDIKFNGERLQKLVRSKAYLYRGVTLQWRDETATPMVQERFHYANGLEDYLLDTLADKPQYTDGPFTSHTTLKGKAGEEIGRVEIAIGWPLYGQSLLQSYVNTVPTPQGGTHVNGLRQAVLKSLKNWADLSKAKMASINADDVLDGATVLISAFIRDPQFQGQTKDKLTNSAVTAQVAGAVQDPLDLWLASNPNSANALLERANERARERARRAKEQEVDRKSPTRRLRLPGKLADCTSNNREETELFLVEGDSAGGSAKQARDRATQAILPLRGKILNVSSATGEKLKNNKELSDLLQALGVRMGDKYNEDDLRYGKVVIMTDADVDGAHIATLLMTFFYEQMPQLVLSGRLYLALPPLYRISQGGQHFYAADDAEKDAILEKHFKGKKPDVGRFKGLGEMLPAQLKETTMNPKKRKMMQVQLASMAEARSLVTRLMGKDPSLRLDFIRENASAQLGLSQQLDI